MTRAAAGLAVLIGGLALGTGVGDGRAPRRIAVIPSAASTHLPAYRGAENPPLTGSEPAAAAPAPGGTTSAPGATTTTTAPTTSGPTTTTTAPPPPETVALGVQETETPMYATKLSRTSVPAGAVTVQLQNTGEDPHNLLILRGDGSVAARFSDTDPGEVVTKTVTFAAGTYRLSCTLSAPVSHDAAGMHASLTVTG